MLQQSSRSQAIGVALGGMAALAAALGIGRFIYTPILAPMASALLLSKSTAGLIASANFLGYLAGALLAAVRLPGSRRTWLLTGLCAVVATTAGMAWGGTTAVFVLLRFAGGVASALVFVLASALVVERLAALGHSGLSGLHFAGVGFGIAISAATLVVLQANGVDWRSLWLVAGAIAGLAVPACAILLPRDAPVSPRPANGPVAVIGTTAKRGLLYLYICYGLFGFGYIVTATFLVAALHQAAADSLIGVVAWLVVGLAAIPSTTFWSLVGRRIDTLPAFSIACVMSAVGVASGGLWSGTFGAMLAAVLLGGTFVGLTSLGLQAAGEIAGRQQRHHFAIMTACFGIGQMAGPLIAGWLIDRTHGFVAPSLMGAAAMLMSGLFALQSGRATRSRALCHAQ